MWHWAGNFKRALNAADRKSCRRTERHSHSFPLNNIIAYLSQIIVNVLNDFTLGYKLCIEHFTAKHFSFRGSNTVCMLHIESCNTDCAFCLLCFFKHELQTHLCHIVHSWSKLMSVWWLVLDHFLNWMWRVWCMWYPWLLQDAALRFCTVCQLHILIR